MSAQWLRAVSDRRLSLCSSFCCWNWKCLNYSGKKIQCDEDSGCDGLSSVKIQYCVLTKAVKLSSTRRLLRAVSSFGLHGAPCFFGAGPASKLCIRITTQAHTTFRKPANAQAHIFKKFIINLKVWKNCAFWDILTNKWGRCYSVPALYFILHLLKFSKMTSTVSYSYAITVTQDHF